MQSCPSCGTSVLRADPSCPHCGARVAGGIGRSPLVAALLGLAAACSGKDGNTADSGTADTDTTAQPPYGIGSWTDTDTDADADADSDADSDADTDSGSGTVTSGYTTGGSGR